MIINSFKNYGEANSLSLHLPHTGLKQIVDNYTTVIKSANLFMGYKNSLIVTFISVTLVILLSSSAAFIISRRKQKLIQYINILIILGMTVPISIVPTYFIVRYMGLGKSFLGISLVYVASNFSIAVFLYTGFLKSIPRDIDESAIIDGCGSLMLFSRVIFPLLKPVTVTVLICSFMTVWNDFLMAIFLLNSPKKFTAVLTTYAFYGEKSSNWNLLFADVILISLPVVLLYLFLQRFIVSGMTSGAVKG
jgi:ABC-type sugar transport system, permease component